jgi:hypothetical protein
MLSVHLGSHTINIGRIVLVVAPAVFDLFSDLPHRRYAEWVNVGSRRKKRKKEKHNYIAYPVVIDNKVNLSADIMAECTIFN